MIQSSKMKYRMKSLEELFLAYQFENDRISKEDADVTKKLIVDELYRRMKYSIDMLENAETEEEAKRILFTFCHY